jgi:hypothetical protein
MRPVDAIWEGTRGYGRRDGTRCVAYQGTIACYQRSACFVIDLPDLHQRVTGTKYKALRAEGQGYQPL